MRSAYRGYTGPFMLAGSANEDAAEVWPIVILIGR